MLAFIGYPYLTGVLVLLALFAAGFVRCREQRLPMVISAFLFTPFALAGILFVPEYWNPKRVFAVVPGVEDVLFNFAVGGLGWLLAVYQVRTRIAVRLRPSQIMTTYVAFAGLFGSLFLVMVVGGVQVMLACLVAALVAGVVTARPHGPLYRLSLNGTFAFAVPYIVLLKTAFVIWPSLPSQWNAAILWGPRLLGLPLEEVLWAVGMAVGWPQVMARAFNVRLMSTP